MAKKKGIIGAAAAFAASPQGRKLIAQGREYAARPENRAKAEKLIAQVRNRGKGITSSKAKPTVIRGETVTPPRPETPPR